MAVIVGAGCFLLPAEEELLAPPLLEAPEVNFRTHVAELGAIQHETIVTGHFVYREQVSVFFRDQAGPLRTVHVGWGDTVEVGQLLAEIETSALVWQMAFEELDLKHAELVYARAVVSGSERFAVGMAEIEVQKAELRLRQLEDELARSRLVSPIAGRVVYVAPIEPGQQIASYRTVVQVADPSDLILSYRGQERRDFRTGMAITVRIGRTAFSGEVIGTPADLPADATEAEAEAELVLFRVDDLPNETQPGAAAVVHLVLERREGVVVVPRSVIQTHVNRTFVLVLEDGLPLERNVDVGIETPTRAEIREGLEPGEAVVVR